MSDLQTAAVKYATLGWGVIRLHHVLEDGTCSCRNTACDSIGKHPLDPQGASAPETDAYNVNALWARTPDANIGIVAGISRLLILDFDSNEAIRYFKSIADDATIQLLKTAPSVQTGRGIHVYLADPHNTYTPSVGKDTHHGIDVRAATSYVVAPPSNHATGTNYAWRREPTSTRQPPEPTPWLHQYLTSRTKTTPVVYQTGQKIIEGNRNVELASIAGTLRRRGLTEPVIRAALHATNQDMIADPLDEEEVNRIAHSIAKRAPGEINDTISLVNIESIYDEIVTHDEPRRYTFLTPAEIAKLPDIAYLVDGLLPINGYGIVYGRRGSAKTFEMLHMSLCIATGIPYRGRNVEQGKVAYIMSEGATGLKKRLAAWHAYYVEKHPDITLDNFYALPTSVQLNDPELRAHLNVAINDIPGDVKLLVIDTLARSVSGLDENSSADMTRFVGYIDEIRQHRNIAVVPVHHSGWDDSHERGSTVIGDAADWVCKIRRDEDKIIVKTEKVKDDELPRILTLEMTPVAQTGSVVLTEVIETIPEDARLVELIRTIHERGEGTHTAIDIERDVENLGLDGGAQSTIRNLTLKTWHYKLARAGITFHKGTGGENRATYTYSKSSKITLATGAEADDYAPNSEPE